MWERPWRRGIVEGLGIAKIGNARWSGVWCCSRYGGFQAGLSALLLGLLPVQDVRGSGLTQPVSLWMGILETAHPAPIPIPNQGCAAGLQGGAAGLQRDGLCSGFADLGSLHAIHALSRAVVCSRPQLSNTRPHPDSPQKPELWIGQGHLLRALFPAGRWARKSPHPSPRSVSVSVSIQTSTHCRRFRRRRPDHIRETSHARGIFLSRLASPGRATRRPGPAPSGTVEVGRSGWESGIGNWGRSTKYRMQNTLQNTVTSHKSRCCGMLMKRGRVGQAAGHLADAESRLARWARAVVSPAPIESVEAAPWTCSARPARLQAPEEPRGLGRLLAPILDSWPIARPRVPSQESQESQESQDGANTSRPGNTGCATAGRVLGMLLGCSWGVPRASLSPWDVLGHTCWNGRC